MSKYKRLGPFSVYKTENVLFGGTAVINYGVEIMVRGSRLNLSFTRYVRPLF